MARADPCRLPLATLGSSLPHFADFPLDRITVEEIDHYRAAKVRESERLALARDAEQRKPVAERKRLPRPLSSGTIHKTIRMLATILEQAVEYGHIPRNPAASRKRLLKESKPSRSYLQPDQVAALLAADGELDAVAMERNMDDTGRRKPLLATLVLAGLRISEALDLRWRDINLAACKLRVTDSKTDAPRRNPSLITKKTRDQAPFDTPYLPLLVAVLPSNRSNLAATGSPGHARAPAQPSECPTWQPTPGHHIVRDRGRVRIKGTNGALMRSCWQRPVASNVVSDVASLSRAPRPLRVGRGFRFGA